MRQSGRSCTNAQPNRQHHDIEHFRDRFPCFVDIANSVPAISVHRLDVRNSGLDEANPQIVFGAVVILLEIFAEGSNIDIKNGRVQRFRAVLFG